ncbi:hypothetical protein TRIUR3_18208 [Triticum urartu]|uniref:FYR C-terminal domain-containing protein n=1 Tax=Triticum urartu TaxID=4572 RepID=M8AU11_TRIUA|nr:hypothetical protein TRIUR3_18208 [Triticum urartu]
MAAKEADGDRFIEMVSAGALYRGGEWERKYWSCSRVTSTEGDCATGQTPDIAWKNFHKKTGAKVRDWQRLFGFKNASVQRLLRQLLVDSTGFGIDMPSPKIYGAASPSTDTVAADVSDDHKEQHVCLDKTVVTAKRSMNPIQEEGTAKRAHNQDMLTSVDNSTVELDKSARQSFNKKTLFHEYDVEWLALADFEGDPVSNSQLSVVSTPICMPPLLEEIPCDSKCTLVNDNLGDYVPNSSQEDGLSSSSYLGSEKSDLEAAEKEVARSMMTFLLPQAIPLLEKTYRRRKVKQKKKEDAVLARSVAAQNPSADGCKGATSPTSVGEGNMNGSQTHVHKEPLCEAVKDIGPNDDCMKEQISKSDDMKAVVADSFEDDGQIGGDSRSKPTGAHHEFDDACSKEPNENLKLLKSTRENHAQFSESQVEVHNRKDIPDVVYDHEKGQYVLSDSLLACLEEEFGMDDSSHPAHYNHGNSNVEPVQRQHQLKDPKEGNNGSSISTDRAGDKNMGNGHDVSHALSNINHVNGLLSKHPGTSARGSDHHLELMGCYLHPMPVLSIMLNTKDSSSLHIYVLCGSSESCNRFLYIYDITLNDHHEKPPNFVGYTTLLLPSLEQASTGNCGDNSLKIVSVNLGYISLLTKLMPSGTVSCFLISEPNYVVAAEDSRNLHVWIMVTGWSVISEEYVISSSGNVGPSILELRKMPKSSSLIIGHDGAGGFCLCYRRVAKIDQTKAGRLDKDHERGGLVGHGGWSETLLDDLGGLAVVVLYDLVHGEERP